MSQEQFAKGLNVTRQAVSNWENNRNLPDISMLIRISDVYHVSLDLLIKGEQNMNNMTTKIIQDGSENRRARYYMVSAILSSAMILTGIMCLLIKAASVEYIDAQGFLHENFFLLPIGFTALACGLLIACTIPVRYIIQHNRNQN